MSTVESGIILNQQHAKAASAIQSSSPARMLHVLTLTPFYPYAGNEAAGCFIAEPLRALAEQGVLSTVIAAQPLHNSWNDSNASTPSEWVRYPQLPGNFGLSGAGRSLFFRLLAKLKRLHRNHPIDLIHAHAALPCGHAATLLSSSLRIPFVVTVHGLDVFNTCFQHVGPAVRRRHEISANVYRRAARVICISDKVRKLIVDELPEVRTAVIYNGTDTNFFSPAESPTENEAILIVGTLLRGKGQELVLRAMSRLSNQHPRLRCKMIGEGADRERFAALAKELGLENRVEFLGRRTRTEVATELRDSVIFALPSRYEGLGCAYLEAMSCGKPVIACYGQGIDEIIRHGENGWLIPVDGLDDLAEGLRVLLNSRERRMKMGQAARDTILKELTLQHQAQSLVTIYREVAQ